MKIGKGDVTFSLFAVCTILYAHITPGKYPSIKNLHKPDLAYSVQKVNKWAVVFCNR